MVIGVADLVPKRKELFTRAILVDGLLATPPGFLTNLGPFVWGSRMGVSLRALIATLVQAGFRKGEVSVPAPGSPCGPDCLSRAALTWVLRGRAYKPGTAPSHLLRCLQHSDFAVLIPCSSKADPFDVVWGGEPIWLPFQYREPLCACDDALASLELAFFVASAVDASSVALFTTDAGLPFSASQLDRLLSVPLKRFLPRLHFEGEFR
ncbi:MAG: hypothetical protein SGPRY_014563, partial [Prymnesium sp.]